MNMKKAIFVLIKSMSMCMFMLLKIISL